MTLARKLCGLVAVVGSAAPVAAQYAPPRPAPQGPTRLVFVAPPWITNGPRTGMPAIPGVVTPPVVNDPQPVAPRPMPLPAAPGVVVPAIPPVPPVGVTPAGATAPRPAPTARPDVWRPGTPTVPGTVRLVPAK